MERKIFLLLLFLLPIVLAGTLLFRQEMPANKGNATVSPPAFSTSVLTTMMETVAVMGNGCVPPKACFSYQHQEDGYTVSFQNCSTGEPRPACVWLFGDGGGSTSCWNASHTYGRSGIYTVTLTVVNACGGDQARHRIVVPLHPCVFLPLLPAEQVHLFEP
ncbi:MAG: PKD domain-containing protein [Thermoproteota archaeon]